jgi:hypothetical protein
MVADLRAAVFRHHAAMAFVVIATPIKMIESEGETAIAARQRLQHLDAGIHHFGADAIAGNGGNAIGLHPRTPTLSGAWQRGADGAALAPRPDEQARLNWR